MESIVALFVLAALICAYRRRAREATVLLAIGLAGILALLGCHATTALKLLF
ncbi:MAG: hypothetical protein ABIP97_01565 [Chthoniobacterales bacterium]